MCHSRPITPDILTVSDSKNKNIFLLLTDTYTVSSLASSLHPVTLSSDRQPSILLNNSAQTLVLSSLPLISCGQVR
jgi:hypothetical protein